MDTHKFFVIVKTFFKIMMTVLAIMGACFLLSTIYKGVALLKNYDTEARKMVEASDKDSFRKQETSFIYDVNGKQISKLKLDKDTQYIHNTT